MGSRNRCIRRGLRSSAWNLLCLIPGSRELFYELLLGVQPSRNRVSWLDGILRQSEYRVLMKRRV
jgi:hypothetical protein